MQPDRPLFYAQLIINLAAPFIAQQALQVSKDPAIVRLLADKATVAVIDLQLQLGIVCVSSVILFLTTWGRTAASDRFKWVCRAAALITGLCILGIFMGGGARLLTLAPYIKTEPSGGVWQMIWSGILYIIPPLRSWLTWIRIIIVGLTFLVEYYEKKEPHQTNGAVALVP